MLRSTWLNEIEMRRLGEEQFISLSLGARLALSLSRARARARARAELRSRNYCPSSVFANMVLETPIM